MDHLLEIFHSEHYDDLLDVNLQMLQALLVVSPPSKFYSLSTVLFHKDGGANVAVTNCMSHFSMFVPTKATVKVANGNTGHAQVIGIILCLLPNCSIIYPVGPVYYFPDHPSNTISSGALNFYIGFLKVTSEPLECCDFLTLRVVLGDHPTRLKPILTIFNSKLSRSILIETIIFLSQLSVDLKKNSLSTYSSEFWSFLYHHNKTNGKKRTHGRSPRKSP